MVIKEIAALWKADKKQYVKESTYSAYALLVANHVEPFFGEKCVFTESDLQDFVLCSLKKGLSEKTVKDVVVVIKMIQKFAVKKARPIHSFIKRLNRLIHSRRVFQSSSCFSK